MGKTFDVIVGSRGLEEEKEVLDEETEATQLLFSAQRLLISYIIVHDTLSPVSL